MARSAILGIGSITVSIILALSVPVQAAPTPTDSTGNAMGLLPGTYPTIVSGANFTVEQFTPAILGSTGSDTLRVSVPSSGPIEWTESRHNEGDIALLIGPGDPDDPAYAPPTTFYESYRPLAGDPAFAETTIAWRVNQRTGAALATVRHNGVDFGPDYTFNGTQVGTVHGIAYFNQTAAQGWGYRMSDGMFANGGEGSVDLQMGVAGIQGSDGEASFDFATAYFPYEQGWIGAWVNGGTFGEATFSASSPGLATSSVNWSNDQAIVTLPGVDSATDGMLFVAPTHDNNATNIAAAFPDAGGWTVTVRDDQSADFSGGTILSSTENQFQFLYVPYGAARLIGGHIQGSDATSINSAGDARFEITRNAAGEYALSVFDADEQTKLTEDDGTLILSVAKSMDGNPTLADRTFLSYEYDSGSGDFVIQSRALTAIDDFVNSENQFGDVLSLTDTNFYFAWIDFNDPLAPLLQGDYNEDGEVNAADYVLWRDNLNGAVTLANDATPGMVDDGDYDQWVANFGQSDSGIGSGLSTGAAVPEPSYLALALSLLAPLSMARLRGWWS